jgi:hypothetical protein
LRYINPPHRRRTGGPGGAAQRGVRLDLGGVSQSTLWRQGWTLVRFIFIFYFVRLPLCNKYFYGIVTFISIHSVIICVVFFGAYMRCTRLYSLNPGVTAAATRCAPSTTESAANTPVPAESIAGGLLLNKSLSADSYPLEHSSSLSPLR